MKVLIVDDSDSMRNIERSLLVEMNIETVEAENGIQALELLRTEHHFDLILLDINMPKMNGLETLKKIKECADYTDIPVIMCTTCKSKEHVSAALKLGANNYIVKPFTTESFIRKVEKTIAI